MVKRDKKGRWLGSGNLKGRPIREQCITNLLKEKLFESDESGAKQIEVIVDQIIELAKNGDRPAISLIFNRIEGKPFTSDPNQEVNIPDYTGVEFISLKRR